MSRVTKTAAIVDDERPARRLLRRLLESESDFEIVADCANATEAIREIDSRRPDIIFLDIRMPQRDGFGVLQELDHAYRPLVVFVTAYDEYAVKAFEFHALDYILKPVDPDRFRESLRRIRDMTGETRQQRQESLREMLRRWETDEPGQHNENGLQADYDGRHIKRLFARYGRKLVPIDIENVESIESDGHYLRIHTTNREFMIYGTLTGMEQRLDPERFVRIHRTAIVHAAYVLQVDREDSRTLLVKLRSGRRLRVSRNRRESVGPILRRLSDSNAAN